jgi:hypothetical protein
MHSIWAVATNTIKQALRMKIAAVFIILLVVLLPVMGASVTGDGTLKGRLQTFVSYGLSLTSLLLCLLTIIVSIYSLTSDIEQRQIYTVLTKPVRRFQLLLGKLLGVILLDVALLILFSAIIYAITIYTPKFANANEAENLQAQNEFYTARATLKPPQVNVSQEVLDAYNKLKKTGQLAQLFQGLSKKKIIAAITSRKLFEKQAVEVGRDLVWEFDNVKPLDPDQSLFIRFKYDVSVNPPDLQVYGRWVVGDIRQIRYGTKRETPIYNYDRKDLIRTFYEFEVPADAVAEDGYLAVGFLNVPLNNTVVIFPLRDGLEVLYKADTFTANFIRAAVLILFRLIFLAALGILTASFLSFPVAILLSLCVFFTATFGSFCLESFELLSENLSGLYYYTVRPVILLLPQFDKFNPTKFLIHARLLGWPLLATVALSLICIKAVLLLLLALLIFSFREVAKVII